MLDYKTIESELNKTSLNGVTKSLILEFLEKQEAKTQKELNKGLAKITKKIAMPELKKGMMRELWLDKSGQWLTDGNYAILKSYCIDDFSGINLIQKDFNDGAFCLDKKQKYSIDPLDFTINKVSKNFTKLVYKVVDFEIMIDKRYFDAIIKPFVNCYDIVLNVSGSHDIIHIYDKQNKKIIAVLMPLNR